MSGNIYADQENENEEDNDTGIKVPDTKDLLARLQASGQKSLEYDHAQKREQEQKEEEAQGQGKGKKKQQRRPAGGEICVCGHPSCRIGPMNSVEG